jgi:predicted NACHT family NTPase
MSDSRILSVKPIIHYPRVAQVGKTYLMTIDLEVEAGAEWQYEEEEYPIYCTVDSELFSSKPVGEPVVVLHRFGGSYGESKFLLTADTKEALGTIKIILVNKWGVSVKQISLESISIVQTLLNSRIIENLTELSNPQAESVEKNQEKAEIDDLVRELRKRSESSIRKRCGTMRILDMTQPIDSGAIYIDVNILERVAGRTLREIQEMMADVGAERDDRFSLSNEKQERMEGLKALQEHRQLMLFGNPGVGKTTFLKRLAIGCLNGDFLANRLPIFVTLKEFAEAEGQPGILEFMGRSLGIVDFMGKDCPPLTQILVSGKALVLLDGLDEVMEKDHDLVIREIREFAEQYNQNHIVITRRIAAQEYMFQQFTEVEMADFDDVQIRSFADKWFKTKELNPESTTGEQFWNELKSRKPLKELAANPLLLTLLCLEFDNSQAFPQSRSELYDRALHVLLAIWDGHRRIQRGEEVYKKLSLKRKKMLLGQLAMYTFERSNYFFTQKVAIQQIEQYIRNLPRTKEDPAVLEVDGWAVLKSIESRHGILAERAAGIYSFSHLTFHEYFAARNILDLSNLVAQEVALGKLIEHIGEKRWREVFLLVTEGLNKADYSLQLMKQRIDAMVSDDSILQRLLEWVQRKSESVKVPYKLAAVRAFYHDIDINRDTDRDIDPDIERDIRFFGDLALDPALDRALALALDRTNDLEHANDRANDLEFALDLALEHVEDLELRQKLQEMYERLPDFKDRDQFDKWWIQHGNRWRQDLYQITIKYRNIGHDWQFTSEQIQKLRKYYEANLLLAQCLNSECYVSREVREEIEETMLLPVTEIERWKKENINRPQFDKI